jgi:hypothetical protein
MNLFNPLELMNRAVCGGISAGAAYDCDNPIQSGMDPRIWLANKADIASITVGANSSVITAITMESGGAFYVFDGYRQSVNAEAAFVPQTVSSGYDHIVNLQVFDISSTQKLNLEKMALSKMVAIVENQNATGNDDTVFEVFGYGVGMEVETLTRINRDIETAGSFSIGLKTSDAEGKEAKLPLSFWDTDYATTLARIVALETPAP